MLKKALEGSTLGGAGDLFGVSHYVGGIGPLEAKERPALAAGGSRSAAKLGRQPARCQDSDEGPVDSLVESGGRTVLDQVMVSGEDQTVGELGMVENCPATGDSPDEGQGAERLGKPGNLGMLLEVAEGDCGGRPTVKTQGGPSLGAAYSGENRLINGHVGDSIPSLVNNQTSLVHGSVQKRGPERAEKKLPKLARAVAGPAAGIAGVFCIYTANHFQY